MPSLIRVPRCLQALARAGLRTTTPSAWDERAHIISVIVPDAGRIMDVLREQDRIIINVKDDALRVSMSFFNHEEEIEHRPRDCKACRHGMICNVTAIPTT